LPLADADSQESLFAIEDRHVQPSLRADCCGASSGGCSAP
jgi:hypothetical protein